MLDDITFGWWWTGTNSQSSTSKALTWIQCKLGKQYLVKKFTLPWESNPGPTPIRGDTATLIASVGLKKKTLYNFIKEKRRSASLLDVDNFWLNLKARRENVALLYLLKKISIAFHEI